MNYKLTLPALALLFPLAAGAQTAIEALEFSQPDMKGTARFMSMGGAFGALGGDLSTLSQNPAGIGVYRSNDIGFTLNLDCQSASATSQGFKVNNDQTKFLLNNIGGVFTLKLPSSSMPNFNFGFTYNKSASFNRRYSGRIPQLNMSMTNYIAGLTNDDGNGQPFTETDMTSTSTFNPYFPNDGLMAAPWLSILGYQSFLTTPVYDKTDTNRENPYWEGQWGDRTSGSGYFDVEESGGIDSYNIAFGGNISNIVFWGMDFDIINFKYNRTTTWGEDLTNAYVEMTDGIQPVNSNWNLNNRYSAHGTGFNYKLGFIVKPIQELRLGIAFHTPTWYSLTEDYIAWTNYRYGGNPQNSQKVTNDGVPGTTDMNYRSPWRVIASAAGVIGGRFIISFDYEWQGMNRMKFSQPSYDSYDYGYDDWGGGWDYPFYAPKKEPQYNYIEDNSGYAYTNSDIRTYCQNTNTYRIGAEFRVTPNFSVRAGYSYVSSPVKTEARDGRETIYTSDLNPSYRFDRETNYITAGLGWHSSHFYVDAAYVYKNMKSTFHAFTPDPSGSRDVSPSADLNFNNSQVVLSMGVKF